jgi:hypothetical protein
MSFNRSIQKYSPYPLKSNSIKRKASGRQSELGTEQIRDALTLTSQSSHAAVRLIVFTKNLATACTLSVCSVIIFTRA